jgi:hypothetical protein
VGVRPPPGPRLPKPAGERFGKDQDDDNDDDREHQPARGRHRRTISRRVVDSEAVAAPPQTLEALVRDELHGPVSELVRQVVVELVREQLNGAAQVHVEPPGSPSQRPNGPGPAPDTPSRLRTRKRAGSAARQNPARSSSRAGDSAGPAGTARKPDAPASAALPLARSRAKWSLPVPTPPSRRRNGYRLAGSIYTRLAEERRALIENTEVELVERDGRVWQLRRLPSAMRK